jgi:ferredoxin
MERKVRVTDACIGIGNCTALAPDVFAIGANRTAEVIDPNATGREEAVQAAADGCPMSSIEIVEDGAA